MRNTVRKHFYLTYTNETLYTKAAEYKFCFTFTHLYSSTFTQTASQQCVRRYRKYSNSLVTEMVEYRTNLFVDKDYFL